MDGVLLVILDGDRVVLLVNLIPRQVWEWVACKNVKIEEGKEKEGVNDDPTGT